MKFIADLHVHSRFSRATAKNLNPENLYISAQEKGITVLATGDFTHPGWFAELKEKLLPAEPGLFRLKEDIARECDRHIPKSCHGEVRFALETEISNIYKKNGVVRKNHNLIYVPDFDTAARLNARLDAIGNIKSDGRPILGLDARNLLEIMLECSDEAMLIPAHIWTPWFSMFGSKSGFDSLAECFEELSSEIFAVETGLSSDAPMNWRISELDSRVLVSNSDAHSPANLGRNANFFDTELSFPAIRAALKAKDPKQCLGTLDLYPEEGKYHMDGHRKCNLWLKPSESIEKKDICPVCGKPLTLGVLHRVEALADRAEGVKPENALPFRYIIPLPEILSEIFSVGSKSKKVTEAWRIVLETVGPELQTLLFATPEDIAKAGIPLLDEAIRRMRAGEIHISPGYDGEYGRITVFTPEEKEKLLGQSALFSASERKAKKKNPKSEKNRKSDSLNTDSNSNSLITDNCSLKPDTNSNSLITDTCSLITANCSLITDNCSLITEQCNEEQQQAVEHTGSPLLIIAGPGAGKTRTLTQRIAWLIQSRGISPENILAVTFTNKAAREMKDRLSILLKNEAAQPFVSTFHAFAYKLLQQEGWAGFSVIDDEERKAIVADAMHLCGADKPKHSLTLQHVADLISTARQRIIGPEDDISSLTDNANQSFFSKIYSRYQQMLAQEKLLDYDDLIFHTVRILEQNPDIQNRYTEKYQQILVDEYQDINEGQYRIIRALAQENSELCVIGDPDQAIYGFRGADVRYFHNFTQDYPSARIIRLNRNYRSAESILESSQQVIRSTRPDDPQLRIYSGIQGVKTLTILEQATEKAEAVAVGKLIEKICGGTGFHSIDFGKTGESGMKSDRGFSDFAVLYRTHAQAEVIAEVFEKGGIPFQIASRDHAWGEKGIAELLSWLKLTEHFGTFHDLEKIIRRDQTGSGKKSMDIFSKWFYQSEMTLTAALDHLSQQPMPDADVQKTLHRFMEKIQFIEQELEGKSIAEKLLHLRERSGLSSFISESRKRENAFDRTISLAEVFGNDIKSFLEITAFETDQDTCDFHAEKVNLMSLHASKGLEFPVVFICGCENGMLPYKGWDSKPVDLDEERRLLYVGMTRAKEELFLSWAKKRTVYGKTLEREISPFVRDIEDRLLTLEKGKAKRQKEKLSQLDIFA
ncbi:MAG: UvrD-helicase domain-containing protein [Desulfococcaceae bacterium]